MSGWQGPILGLQRPIPVSRGSIQVSRGSIQVSRRVLRKKKQAAKNDQFSLLVGAHLTHALNGGGEYYPPPVFSSWLIDDSRYRHESFSTLFVINYASSPQISEKSVDKCLRKWCFSDVMFRYFGSKSGKCLKASGMYSFEVNKQSKMPKGVTFSAEQNSYLKFLVFLFSPTKL